MSYFRFLSTHRRLLGFGLLMALSSSFGQTFFISLFLPYFLSEFSLDNGEFGFLYAGSTLLGALCLPYLGRRIDALELRRYTTFTVLGLATAALVVAFSPHVVLLAAGIVGLRLTGQGLLGHISQTVMAREFFTDRGKALGFASLGYPLGEGILPLACAVALRFVSWPTVWVVVAVGAATVILPLALRLLRLPPAQSAVSSSPAKKGRAFATDPQRSPWRDARLYKALPTVLLPPFVMTGMFLYQMPLSEAKGWAPEWMAAAFTGFAASRALSSLAVGPLIDRFSATRLLAFYLLPLGAGLLLVRVGSAPWIAFPYLLLAGVTAGANGSIASAMWAEIYGVANLGRVRSVVASLAVVCAAGSPAVMGALFHRGVRLEAMVSGAIALVVAASLSAAPVFLSELRRASRRGATDGASACSSASDHSAEWAEEESPEGVGLNRTQASEA